MTWTTVTVEGLGWGPWWFSGTQPETRTCNFSFVAPHILLSFVSFGSPSPHFLYFIPYCVYCFRSTLSVLHPLWNSSGILWLTSIDPHHCYFFTPDISLLLAQPTLLMKKLKRRQEKTVQEKSVNRPNVKTMRDGIRGCLPADSENELSSLIIKPGKKV